MLVVPWSCDFLPPAATCARQVCLTVVSSVTQTATDSSSNSSQRREPLAVHPLAPPHFCEARRHQCILGHFYEQHWPSECHFLDQVRRNKALLTFSFLCFTHQISKRRCFLDFTAVFTCQTRNKTKCGKKS